MLEVTKTEEEEGLTSVAEKIKEASKQLDSILHQINWFDYPEIKEEVQVMLASGKVIAENNEKMERLLADCKECLEEINKHW